MNLQWYEPLSITERLRRAFSFLNLVILFLTALVVFSEFRFDWCERMLGHYLTATNDARPETGTVWKTGQQTLEASRFLNDIIQKKQHTRQEIEQAESFLQIAEDLLPGEWVTIDKTHFKTLYQSLPEPVAIRLIAPARLIWILSGTTLDRIFCEGQSSGLSIYFLDSQNRVIHQLTLSDTDISQIRTGSDPITASLEDIDGFSGKIFPAQQFFNAMFALPEDMIPDLIVNPDRLLEAEGNITKVGIWNEAQAGYINLGFEYEHNGHKQVVIVKGREWAVWQLSLVLREEEVP